MRFIATDRHLLEYGRELQKVYDLSKMAASMDLFIPMELFVLDCTKIKEVKTQSVITIFFFHQDSQVIVWALDCRLSS